MAVPIDNFGQKEKTMCLCGCEGECSGKEKVFCDECKHYRERHISEPPIPGVPEHQCRHPKVYYKERLTPDTPIKRGKVEQYTKVGNCEHINSTNDCPFFEMRD